MNSTTVTNGTASSIKTPNREYPNSPEGMVRKSKITEYGALKERLNAMHDLSLKGSIDLMEKIKSHELNSNNFREVALSTHEEVKSAVDFRDADVKRVQYSQIQDLIADEEVFSEVGSKHSNVQRTKASSELNDDDINSVASPKNEEVFGLVDSRDLNNLDNIFQSIQKGDFMADEEVLSEVVASRDANEDINNSSQKQDLILAVSRDADVPRVKSGEKQSLAADEKVFGLVNSRDADVDMGTSSQKQHHNFDASRLSSSNECDPQSCKTNINDDVNTNCYEDRLSEVHNELKEIRAMLKRKTTKSESTVKSSPREFPRSIVCCSSDAATLAGGLISTPRTQESSSSMYDIRSSAELNFHCKAKPNCSDNASFSPNSSFGRDDDTFFVEKPVQMSCYNGRKRTTLLNLSREHH